MRFDILTLFPKMCDNVLDESVIGRARKAGIIEVECHNIRDFAGNKHNRVDDAPYGGGKGMVMQAEPIFNCFKSVYEGENKPHLIYMSPKGKTFCQEDAVRLAKYPRIAILCGHYEGVDQRVLDEIVDEEISIGDFVVTGGEVPAMLLVDAVSRMIPGVLSEEVCFTDESHFDGLLEYPQYTRPEVWHGVSVPDVLLSGHHKNIKKWRDEQSLEITKRLRPDILK
ncbi:MAG: tRNA (guanosine(37)-N1)-methyltransferase TrmD [Ruminococcaceae bacterium]|nr:tRNA (guanosine(37)-N1)-methyltransferase TrmD [Oscillospiraceae bacterium]